MITIDGINLTIEDVIAVARADASVVLAPEALERVKESRTWVEEIIAADQPVYGINTGFGIFSDRQISQQDAAKLSRNLIISHAVATGPLLHSEIVRAAMLIRANTLAKGHSGVRPLVIETLIAMLNCGVTPQIPSQGSLGSSGDLAQLSHMALVFTTDQSDSEIESSFAEFNGQRMSGKEGLAVNNGATFSAAIAALAVHDANNILQSADIALSMSLEAMHGVGSAFDSRIHIVRNHLGQMAVAERVRQLTQGSTLLDAGERIQDAYSLRCAPQVQGAAVDALRHFGWQFSW
jgi:histidine ammonia-lyase